MGVDEHTACVLDLDAGTATVAGLGAVTVRRQGQMSALVTGTTVPISSLAESGAGAVRAETALVGVGGPGAETADPLDADIDRFEQAFDAAIASGDAPAAVKVALELDDLLHDWSRDTTQSDLLDRGRAGLRAMIVRLGEAAEVGVRDPRQIVGPFVEALLDARRSARADNRWSDADTLRDRLMAAGVEVRDTPDGTDWQLR